MFASSLDRMPQLGKEAGNAKIAAILEFSLFQMANNERKNSVMHKAIFVASKRDFCTHLIIFICVICVSHSIHAIFIAV